MSADGYRSFQDLDTTLALLWQLVANGASDRASGFRNFAVGSVGADGGPQVRTVVLREVDASRWRIGFQTDRRSRKIDELARDPRVAAHFWCEERRIQLRMAGRAEIAGPGSPTAAEAYAGIPEGGRERYRVVPAPGHVVTNPDGYRFEPAGESDPGEANFAVVSIAVGSVDFLYLEQDGHRRASFEREAGGAVRKAWLAP